MLRAPLPCRFAFSLAFALSFAVGACSPSDTAEGGGGGDAATDALDDDLSADADGSTSDSGELLVPGVVGEATVATAARVLDPTLSAAVVVEANRLLLPADAEAPEVGQVLVGTSGAGFLRKVRAVDTVGGELVVETERATLEELFDEANVKLTVPVFADPGKADCAACNESPWIDQDFGATTIWENEDEHGKVRVRMTDGHLLVAPAFTFEYVKSLLGGLHFFEFGVAGVIELELSAEVLFASKLVQGEFELPLASRHIVVMVGTVPVIITPELTLKITPEAVFQYSWGKIASGAKIRIDMDSSVSWDKLRDSPWMSFGSSQVQLEARPVTADGSATMCGNLALGAELELKVKIYDVVGPWIAAGPYANLHYCYTDESELIEKDKWQLEAGIRGNLGVDVEAFGWEIYDWEKQVFRADEIVAEGDLPKTCDYDGMMACLDEWEWETRPAWEEEVHDGCYASWCPTEEDWGDCKAEGDKYCQFEGCHYAQWNVPWDTKEACMVSAGCPTIGDAGPTYFDCQRTNDELRAACYSGHPGNKEDCASCVDAESMDLEDCDRYTKKYVLEEVFGLEVDE